MKAYLWNLYCFSTKKDKIICTFQYLIDYGIKHKLLEEYDFNIDCKKHPKYLSFSDPSNDARVICCRYFHLN